MMKDFIGLTLDQAIEEAKAQGRIYKVETEQYEDFIETCMYVSTSEGNGACLYIDEEGKVEEYAFCCWV